MMRKNRIAELLGTKNKKEQAKRIEKLLSSPVLELVIRFDVGRDRVTLDTVGGLIPAPLARKMLIAAEKVIRETEEQAEKKNQENA